MTPQEVKDAAQAQLAEQARQAQERAQEAADAAADAKWQIDCLTAARR